MAIEYEESPCCEEAGIDKRLQSSAVRLEE